MIPGDPLLGKNPDGTQSSVLINKFDLTDQASLDEIESEAVQIRSNQLFVAHRAALEGGRISSLPLMERLQSVHRYMFKDIYEWAGELRALNIAKRDPLTRQVTRFEEIKALGGDPSRVTPAMKVAAKAEFVAKFAIISDWLEGRDIRRPQVAAELMHKLNVLHPFREGNGRATRELVQQLLLERGCKLDFAHVDREAWTYASRSAAQGDMVPLTNVMAKSIGKANPNLDVLTVGAAFGATLKPVAAVAGHRADRCRIRD